MFRLLLYIGLLLQVSVFLASPSGSQFMGRNELFLTLQRHQAAIESIADITIANLNYDPCDAGPCRTGAECSSVFNIMADEVSVVDSPGRVFSGARVEQAVECHCTEDYTGSFCEVHSCAANPCLNAGTCMSEPADGATMCICATREFLLRVRLGPLTRVFLPI